MIYTIKNQKYGEGKALKSPDEVASIIKNPVTINRQGINMIKVYDFYADWCNPCKRLAPIFDDLKKENPNVVVEKINVDEEKNIDLMEKYNIKSIPTVIILHGSDVTTIVCLKDKGYYEDIIKKKELV